MLEQGLEKLGANTDTKESVSDIAGGLVGGATTAVVGDLAAVGSAALVGAEVGELGGPVGIAVGAGVGAAFGLAAYGLGKLNHISAVQKAENEVELLDNNNKDGDGDRNRHRGMQRQTQTQT